MTQAQIAATPPRHYEAIYILRPDVTKEASERVAARVEEVVTREGGKITLVENWGRRPLAYEIQHQKRGVYIYVNYLGNGRLVSELERNFRMLDEVVRFQTVKLSDDPGELEVDAAQTKFEAFEASGDDEETTLEQELGLVPSALLRREESFGGRDDFDDDDDMPSLGRRGRGLGSDSEDDE